MYAYMKTITIKTPLERKKNKLDEISAHLLEHILIRNFSLSEINYFDYIIDISAATYYGYTTYQVPDQLDEQKILAYLTSDFTKEVFEIERKALKKELEETNQDFISKITWKITKKLYNPYFLSRTIKKPSFEELQEYHRRWYNINNIIITDKNDEYIHVGKNFKKLIISGKNKDYNPMIKHISVQHNTHNINCFTLQYDSWKDNRLWFFIYDLLKNFNIYQARYWRWNYYYEDIDFLHIHNHIIIVYSEWFDDNITPEFFNAYKKYYLKEFQKSYDTFWRVIDMMYDNKTTTIKEAKEFIKWLSFPLISNLLKKA